MNTRNVLIISGLDPSGGAGFIADIRLAEQLGCRAVGNVTALTEQNTKGVVAVHPVSPRELLAQLTTLLTDVEVHAVKLGMFGTDDVADAIAEALELTSAPVVWDPILAPTRGGVPLYIGNLATTIARMSRHVTVVTPNAIELSILTRRPLITDVASAHDAARALHGLGLDAVLVKGGHLSTSGGDATDSLITTRGDTHFPGERIALTEPIHGTGCALSTAIACRLALGDSLTEACRAAKMIVASRIASPVHVGGGRASVL